VRRVVQAATGFRVGGVELQSGPEESLRLNGIALRQGLTTERG